MASTESRRRNLLRARAKRAILVEQCLKRGIPAKTGYKPTTLGRMRRKLTEAGFMPVA